MTLRIRVVSWQPVWLSIVLCFLVAYQVIGQKTATPKSLVAAPSLIVTPTTLTGFTTEQGQPSDPQAYTIIGSELTDSIRVTASAGVEISPNGTYYSSSITLPPSTSFAIIIVRLTGAFTGSIVGTITNTSTGSVPRNVSVRGTVTQATGNTPIASARQLPENSFAIIQGIVTVNKQFDNAQLLYIQDKTGGIALFVPATSGALFPLFQTQNVQVGNEIQVIGQRVYRKGIVGLTSVSSVSVINASTILPTPKRITAFQMADAENQGLYVQIDSSAITSIRSAFVPEVDYTFSDGSQAQASLRIRTGVNDLVNSLKPTSKTNLRGIIDGYDTDDNADNGLVGVRLFPRSQSDIPGTTELIQQNGGVADRNQTLDVATWNLDSLGATLSGPILSGVNDVNQIVNTSGILQYLNADVYVLPGVSNPSTLSAIATTLAFVTSQTYTAVCPTGGYYQGENPRVCFLYKNNLFASPPTLAVVSEGFQPASWDGGRFPVLLTGDVILNGLSRRVSFLGIHAHEGTTLDDYILRQQASTQLKSYLDNRPDDSFIVAGDFNDDVDASIVTPNFSPYNNLITATASYSAITKSLSDARLTSTLNKDNVTDHILISSKLFTNYLPGTVNTLSPDAPGTTVLADPSDWGRSTSNHLPVFARFSLATPGSLTATLAGSTTLCGSLTATLSVSVTGGVGPYQVVLTNGSSSTTIANYVNGAAIPVSVTGNATSFSLVSVADALSVTAGTISGTAVVSVIPNARPVSVSITPTSISYCQGRTVPLSTTVGSGQLPLTYRWNTGATTPSISATASGVYSVMVVDAIGCSAIASTTTTVNTIPDLSTFGASTTALCTGASPITTFTANLGTLVNPYSYTLGNSTGFTTGQISTTGLLSQAATISAATVYTLTVSNPLGCTATATQSISVNTTPSLAGFSGSPSCLGKPSTFTASVGGLGFTSPYNFTLTNGATEAVGTGFGTGPGSNPLTTVLVPTGPPTYTLVVANRNCTATAITSVQVGTATPTATLIASNTLVSCIQPSATLTATGGVSYAFSPINGGVLVNNTGTVTVTNTGVYNVIVTDVYGCTASATTIILANVERPTASLIASNQTISCTNPTSTLLANGGSSYQFSGPTGIFAINSTGTATVSQAGTYQVLVTTAGGCTAVATTTIQANNTSSSVQLSANGVLSCGSGSVRLSALHNGTASSYRFSRPDGTVTLTTAPINYIDVTVGGPYQVDVTFPSGCSSTAFLTLSSSSQSQAVTLVPDGQFSCTKSTVRLTAVHNDNATSYRFIYPNTTTSVLTSPPINYIDVTASGTYQVAVTFPGGCSTVATATLSPNSQVPTVALTTSGPLACSQSTVRLSAVHAGDATSYRFTRPDGSVILTNASTNFINISAGGSYQVAVTFPGGCSTVASTFVNTVGGPNVALTASGQLSCDATAASVVLTATHTEDALQYELGYPDGTFKIFGSNRFTVTAAGTYTVKVTFLVSGCVSSASTTVVRDQSSPSVNLSPNGSISCASTTVRLTASTSEAASSYRFTGPSGTTTTTNSYLDVSTAGNYSVTATFPSGCTSVATATVQTSNQAPAIQLTSSGQLGCGVSSVTLTASVAGEAYYYQFLGPSLSSSLTVSNIRVVSLPGTYTVLVGFITCTATASAVITVTSIATPTVTLAQSGELTCLQPTVRLTTSTSQQASSYRFTGPNGFNQQTNASTNYVDVSAGGTYNVIASYPNGCTASASITVSATGLSVPSITLSANGLLSCTKPTVRLTATTQNAVSYHFTGTYDYDNTTTSNFIDVGREGLYRVVATYPNGCTNSAGASVFPSGDLAPSVSLTPDGTLSCSKTSVRITAVHSDNASSYRFTGPNGFAVSTASNFVDVTAAGTYQVVVSFASGCSSVASTNVSGSAGGISASISGNLAICSGNSTVLTVNGGSTYQWSTGAVSQAITVNPTTTTLYTVTVSQGGCSTVLSANVVVSTCNPSSQLSLLAPTYNCDTGEFTFRSSGGDGSTVEYYSIGITGWSASAGPYTVKPASDAQPFTLEARNTANPSTVVTYTWDWKAACSKSNVTPEPPVTTPPTPTTPTETACSSPANTVGQPLQLLAPEFNCQTGAITFKTTGGTGTAIEYMSIGITGWTSNCQAKLDNQDLLNEIKKPGSSVEPFTLQARQNGTTVTYTWDAKATCASGGRLSTPETTLEVTVLGNPTLSEEVEVEIRGAEGKSVAIQLADTRGAIVHTLKIEKAAVVERQTLKLGRTAGMYFMQVNTSTQAKTVKILRQ